MQGRGGAALPPSLPGGAGGAVAVGRPGRSGSDHHARAAWSGGGQAQMRGRGAGSGRRRPPSLPGGCRRRSCDWLWPGPPAPCPRLTQAKARPWCTMAMHACAPGALVWCCPSTAAAAPAPPTPSTPQTRPALAAHAIQVDHLLRRPRHAMTRHALPLPACPFPRLHDVHDAPRRPEQFDVLVSQHPGRGGGGGRGGGASERRTLE